MNGKGLTRRFDSPSIGAMKLRILRSIRVADNPIGGFDDIEFIGVTELALGKIKHVGIHSGFDPVIGLENRDPISLGLADAEVAGGAVTLIGFIDNANSRITISKITHYGKRLVG